MYNVRKVTNDLYWIGANDRRLALFEGVYKIPRGVSYNSYILLDEKTVVRRYLWTPPFPNSIWKIWIMFWAAVNWTTSLYSTWRSGQCRHFGRIGLPSS